MMKHTLGLLAAVTFGIAALPATGFAQSVQVVGDGNGNGNHEIIGDGKGHQEIVVDFDDRVSEDQVRADARSAGLTLVPNSFMTGCGG